MLARQGVIDIVIPLEDRELLMRFGKEYEEYCRRVPRIFPRFQQLRKTQLREIVNFDQAFSTKDKYGLIGWPVMALVLESFHEKFVFGKTDIKDTLLIFLSAAVFYAAVLIARYYKSA